jgi:hypothetical protein
MEAVVLTRSVIYRSNRGAMAIPNEVLDSIFTLAVAERPIGLTTKLHRMHDYDAETAQSKEVLYWEPCTGAARAGMGVVRMPPLLLYDAHEKATSGAGASVHLFKRPAAHSSPHDNETLAVSVFMHILRAAALAGLGSIQLSELLRVELRDIADKPVAVPACFDVHVEDAKVRPANYRAFVERVRSRMDVNARQPVAFVNGRTAEFADAFVVFRDWVLFVQEKQSVKARQQAAVGRAVPPMPEDGVAQEHAKVATVMTKDDIFVYITDDKLRASARVPARCLVIARDEHERLFGSLVSRLRAFAIEESASRAESDSARAVAASPTSALPAAARGRGAPPAGGAGIRSEGARGTVAALPAPRPALAKPAAAKPGPARPTAVLLAPAKPAAAESAPLQRPAQRGPHQVPTAASTRQGAAAQAPRPATTVSRKPVRG